MSAIDRLTRNNTTLYTLPDHVIFDYTALMDALKMYARPRDKVSQLIRTGVITRIKKGFYCDNRKDMRALPVKETAANLIYGPSYISLQFALSLHGLIPETAVQVTSVTLKKTRRYRLWVILSTGPFPKHTIPAVFSGKEKRQGLHT